MLDSHFIKKLAGDHGFDLCGLTPCRHLAGNEGRFREWIARGYHSSLDYLERNTEKRFNPRLLVDKAQTVVVCAVSYKNMVSCGYAPGTRCKVASYALTGDYHKTIKQMLFGMFKDLVGRYPDLGGRAFVDSAPLAEKQLAVDAGLGWIGRQSLLVTPRLGTFVLLGELVLTDRADAYDEPYEGVGCGNCYRCVNHCPTGAILGDRMIDTGRCISCHTIEKEPPEGIDLHGWIFGCDCCQNCCPYNRYTPLHVNPEFDPVFDPLEMTAERWLALSDEEFARRFKPTPLARSGLERIRKNVRIGLETAVGE